MNQKVLPPVYFFGALILMAGLHFFLPVKQIIFMPYGLAGLIPLALGIWLNLWTDSLFKQKNTTVKPFEKPSCIICQGPFKVSRNPMYLGMVFIVLGIAVLCGTATCFAVPLIYGIMIDRFFITREEEILSRAFGMQYVEYKTQVRRWI